MKKGKRASTSAAALRRRAEERLAERAGKAEVRQAPPDAEQRLLHELQVHQIELEMQNEELEHARAELEAGLQRYSELYDFAPLGYLTLDQDGAIRNTNLAGASLLGTERSRLVGKRFDVFVASGSRTTFSDFVKRVFTSHAREACDVTLQAQNQHRPISLHLEAAASADQQECRAVLADVTERMEAEDKKARISREVDEQRARLQAVMDSLPIGLWISDAKGNVVVVNDRARAMWGGKAPASRGVQEYAVFRAWWAETDEVIADDDMPMARALRGDTCREMEIDFERFEGARGTQLVSSAPVKLSDGTIAGSVAVVQDVTEARKLREALRLANEGLLDADRRKNQFLAMVSHELRNPLAPITNSLYILGRAVPGGDQARRAQAVIERQIGQLARLVDDLLDVTRMTRNKIELRRERLELNELVRRTVDDHRAQFEKGEISLELTFAPSPVYVSADWNRLVQVIGNLLHNAAKFSGRKGSTRVVVTTDDAHQRAVVRVVDTGKGMASQMLSRLFEPFSQSDDTLDRSKGGLGLGLALAKGLVELHGGEISAHSDGVGKGAEFVVRLPAEVAEVALPPSRRAEAEHAPRRVLIIDDNADAADSLLEVLELGRHEVAAAYDVPEGLAKARAFRPDVVLCDIGLPGMDGYDFARACRADDALKEIVLVALSGYALPEDLERARKAGFDCHLSKPPSLEKLEQILGEAPQRGDTRIPGAARRDQI